jgi:hypothetical protein
MIDIYLKHSIYSLCIDIIFKEISKNMGSCRNQFSIGATFTKIIDLTGPTYVNCVIIQPSDIIYYDDLDAEDQKAIAIAFIYERVIEDGILDENDGWSSIEYNEIYYYYEEFSQLVFV